MSSGEIMLVNSRTETVFGYGRGELIGRPVETLVPSGLRTGHVSHRDRYFEAPRTRPMGAGLDLYARRKDGSEFPCEISLSTVAADEGMMALAAIRDITDRRRDRDDLRRAVRRLQAATEVAIAVGGETDLERVLDAIVERGRALVEARALIILLREGDELGVVATAAVAGGLDPKVAHLTFKVEEASEEILLGKITGADLGARESGRALIAPLLFRKQSLGLVIALDHVGEPGHFDDEHQRMLESFAASAATGVATARSMAEERLQNTIDAAEQERGRWARELHDETLQSLAVLRMRLASALRDESPDDLHETSQEAVAADRRRDREAATADHRAAARVTGHDRVGGGPLRPRAAAPAGGRDPDRLRLRALPRGGGAARRAFWRRRSTGSCRRRSTTSPSTRSPSARSCGCASRTDTIEIEVSDDGVGFEPNLVREGFGLVGMRERAALLGGTLRIDSTRGAGTKVWARIPLVPPDHD